MNHKTNQVVTRFAPSPTGFMHIGGLRTALFAYLWARKNNGTFILRIEDTDKEREMEGATEHIMKALRWIGLEWDFGPDKEGPFGTLIQSQRVARHKEYAEKLIAKGLAYPDPYSKEEIEGFRKLAESQKKPFLFRNHRPEKFEIWDGTKPLRLKVPEIKKYEWNDAVRGKLSAGEEALDDFVLIKSDGYPTYNFAHIIDDYDMGVTHIFRADEFISSTPRFLSLYEALGITPPVFATLPPILREDRTKKLGKRDGAKDILEYQREGYLPEAMVNFLAFIGWNPGTEQEIFSKEELISAFTLERIQTGGASLNEEKLDWINREYLKKLTDEEFWARAEEYLHQELREQLSVIRTFGSVVRDRVNKFSDIPSLLGEQGELSFLLRVPEYDKAILKTPQFLPAVVALIEAVPQNDFTADAIKNAVWDFATKEGRGNVLWPLRISLTGKEKSPDPFTVASMLGKQESLARIQHAISLADA